MPRRKQKGGLSFGGIINAVKQVAKPLKAVAKLVPDARVQAAVRAADAVGLGKRKKRHGAGKKVIIRPHRR